MSSPLSIEEIFDSGEESVLRHIASRMEENSLSAHDPVILDEARSLSGKALFVAQSILGIGDIALPVGLTLEEIMFLPPLAESIRLDARKPWDKNDEMLSFILPRGLPTS